MTDKSEENQNLPDIPKISKDIMPQTLSTSAETSMILRNAQKQLVNFLISQEYLTMTAATKPEVLPTLLDSITNGVAIADNLLIRMAQVSEKSASMQKVFDYLTKKQETESQKVVQQNDPYYNESVEQIKKAIYKKLDEVRDEKSITAQDFVNEDTNVIEGEVVNDKNEEEQE